MGVGGPGSLFGIATDHRLGSSGINPIANEIFNPFVCDLGPSKLLLNGYVSFPGGKVRQGRAADHSLHQVKRSWKSRAIILPILLVTQDLNRFTLTLPIMYVYACAYIYL